METPIAIPNNIEPELLRQFLAGRDVPCPRCEYNLRDLAGDRCPECGEELVLRVNMVEPRLGALICGLVALSASAGLNGLLVIITGIMALNHSGDELDSIFVCNVIESVILGIALFIWLRCWRQIYRLPITSQWKLAGACCSLTIFSIAFLVWLTMKS